MRPLFAIDWDRREFRFATLTGGSDQRRRIECQRMTWEAAEAAGHEAGTHAAVIEQLKQIPHRNGRAMVAIRRHEIESFSITLPPATEDELPALVEAHAIAHNAELGDDIVSDFRLLGEDDASGPRWTAVVAAQANTIDNYRKIFAEVKLPLTQLFVRPFATAAYLRQIDADASAVLIGHFGEEIDFVVVVRGEIWFWRTVRSQATTSSEEFHAFFRSELARTMAVAEQHLPAGGMPAEIQLVCCESDARPLEKVIDAVTGLPSRRVAPATSMIGVDVDPDADDAPLFAPLIAALADQAAKRRPDIDLLNPRRAAPPKSPNRTRVLAGIAAVVALLLAGLWVHDEVAAARDRVETLRGRLKELKSEEKELATTAKTVDGIEAFVGAGVVWLDELRDLALRFPPPADAHVLDFSASPDRQGGAMIRIRGRVRDPSIVADLDRRLRGKHREILSRNFAMETQSESVEFPWQFESVISTIRHRYEP